MATELAKAYVQIVPSAEGISGSLSELMGGEAASAGESSGASLANSLFNKLKSTLVTLGIGKAITDAINQTGEFETTMAKVSTLFKDGDEEFSALQSKILEVSSQTGMAATTLAEAAYSAESAGVPMTQLGEILEKSAKLAVAGFTDVDTALSATAKTMNAYGDAAGSIDEIQKILIQTQNLGITTVGELGASLANVTPTAAALGVHFDQVGASLALMTSKGVPTAQATTQLRSALTELGKAGTTADKSFRAAAAGTDLAGKSFTEAIESGANLGEVFGLMQQYADASGLSMVDLWGSVEAGNAAMMIASDIETFNTDLAAMSDSANVVEESYQKMADSFGLSMNSLKESAKNVITGLFTGADISASFDAMLDSAGDIADKVLTWLSNGLSGLGNSLPGMMESLLNLGESLLASLGEIDWISVGTSIINGLIGALGTLGTKLVELFTSGLSSVKDMSWSEIGTAIWNGVTSIITTAGDWLKTLFDAAKTAVGEVDFSGIGTSILSGVTSAITSAGDWLSGLFKTAVSAVTGGEGGVNFNSIGTTILNGVTSSLDSAGAFLSDLFTAGKEAVEGADFGWNTIGEAIKTGATLVLEGGKFLVGVFDAGRKMVQAINWTALGGSISNLVLTGLEGAKNLTKAVFEGAVTLIQGIKWTELGSTISDYVISGIKGAQQLMVSVFDGASKMVKAINWTALGGNISNLVNTGLEGIKGLMESTFNAAKGLIDGISWGEIGTHISDLAIEGLTGVQTLMRDVFEGGRKMINAINWAGLGAGISSNMETGLKGAATLLEDAFTAAHTFITKGIDWAQAGQDIQSGLGDVWTGLTGMVSDVFGGVGAAASGVGEGVGAAASGLGNWIKSLFGQDVDLQAEAENLKAAMTSLKEAITNGKADIEEAAKEVGKSIVDGIKENAGESTIKELGTNAGTALAGGLEEQTSAVKGAAEALTGQVETTVTGFDFTVLGTGAGQKITEGLAGMADKIHETAEQLCNKVKTKFEGFDWNGIGKNAVQKITEGAGNEKTAFGNKIKDIADEGKNKMKNAGWKTVGMDIVDGIVSGVSNRAGSLKAKMEQLASEALSAAKKKLGIASPSKVMRDEVGRWIPEGIAEGIQGSSNAVTDAMDEILAAENTGGAIAQTVSTQSAQMGMAARSVESGTADSNTAGLMNQIVDAIREGMENASVNSYLDGELVTENINRRLGEQMSGGRFAFA